MGKGGWIVVKIELTGLYVASESPQHSTTTFRVSFSIETSATKRDWVMIKLGWNPQWFYEIMTRLGLNLWYP